MSSNKIVEGCSDAFVELAQCLYDDFKAQGGTDIEDLKKQASFEMICRIEDEVNNEQ